MYPPTYLSIIRYSRLQTFLPPHCTQMHGTFGFKSDSLGRRDATILQTGDCTPKPFDRKTFVLARKAPRKVSTVGRYHHT